MIDKVGLTVFGAPWCKDCESLKKMLEEQAVNFTYVNIDSAAGKELTKEIALRSIPAGYENGGNVFNGMNQARTWFKAYQFKVPEKKAGEAPQVVLDEVDVDIADMLAAPRIRVQPRRALDPFDDENLNEIRQQIARHNERIREQMNQAQLDGLQPVQMNEIPHAV